MLTYRGYGIPIHEKTEELVKKLTVKPFAIPGYETPEYSIYRYNETKFYMPKFFGLSYFANRVPVNKEREGVDISLKFNGVLRPDQMKYTKEILKNIDKKDSCIACAGTGSGKTIMALFILTMIKKKTLIIVHKDFLMNQWIERINGVIDNPRIGTIKANIVDIEDKDIVIGMLQSISMKKYEPFVYNDFGFVIFDECHHIPSRSFSNALYKVGTKKMLGLSATPSRKDGLTKVLKWFLGDIITKDNVLTLVNKPTVELIKPIYSSDIKVKYNYNGNVNNADLINQIASDRLRNEQITKKIISLEKLGRNIILLSDRREQCIEIAEMLKGLKVGLYLGSMKQEKLKESNDCNVILATYSMAAEGYDNSKLDTLILATGRTDIIQSVGRILRQKNKFDPLIIDFIDENFQRNQVQKRINYYRSNDFIITENSVNKVYKKPDVIDFIEE